MKELTEDDKKNIAKQMYLSGSTQIDIYKPLKISDRTLHKWIIEYNWDKIRAAKAISPEEIKKNILLIINKKLNEALEYDPLQTMKCCEKGKCLKLDLERERNFNATADSVSKMAASIEKMGVDSTAEQAIPVFMKLSKFLANLAKSDTRLDGEFIQKVTYYQNLFIKEKI